MELVDESTSSACVYARPVLVNAETRQRSVGVPLMHAFIIGDPRRGRGGLSTRQRPAHGESFGLLQNSRVVSAYILRLLPRLPSGDSELYSHPSLKRNLNTSLMPSSARG